LRVAEFSAIERFYKYEQHTGKVMDKEIGSRDLWSTAFGALAAIAVVALVCVLAGCVVSPPGAGIKRASYPALTQSTKTYNWLVLKCRLSDAPNIPAGLDTSIQQFFGISGTGFGNAVDYFHDVSYNAASVISDTTVGWVTAPFNTANLNSGVLSPPGMRAQRVAQCLNAIPADQRPDLDQFYGVIVVTNVVRDGGACNVGPLSTVVANKTYQLACVWFDPRSLFTAFAAHEIGHGLGLTH
jgi:hypothetical protein